MTRRRHRERGAMMLVMAGALLLLAMLGVGSITIMRIVLAKQETQRVADSACLAAATIVKNNGLPFDGPKQGQATSVAAANHPGLPFNITYTELPETPDLVSFKCDVSLVVGAPAMIWAGGQATVTATASGGVGQVTLTDATKKYPKLIMVLDYSGSMLGNLLSQPNKTSIQVLKEEVNALLQKNYNIKMGLVIFAGDVLAKVNLALGTIGQITTQVNKDQGCPSQNAEDNCLTDSWDALKAAHDMFGPWDDDENRYVLFISDGAPNNGDHTIPQGITASEAAAQKLFDESHATIFSLQLINNPDSDTEQQLEAYMRQIAGSPDKHPDQCYYFNADSQTQLDSVLSAIGNAVACPLQLAQPPPANTAVHVFLRNGGAEEILGDASKIPGCNGAPTCSGAAGSVYATTPGDLSDQNNCTYYQGDYFLYYAPKQSIFVTPNVCDRIMQDHDTVIIRYAHTQIIQ